MPTYAAGSEELAAYNLLNTERSRCGFGMVAQNTKLDTAAKAHADYQSAFALWFFILVSNFGLFVG